ncbi:lipopolysaccharide O-acetyltransferase [Myxococcaceae bacterium]|nr:lipopolysaccharide O-acetyltransferase [Myxococcaceae bacterium]
MRMRRALGRFVHLLQEHPSYGLRVARALVRGTIYALYYRATRHNVRIELPFYAFGPVAIEGPGQVRIGRRCSVMRAVFTGLTITTGTRDSVVEIGSGCRLGGLTVRCHERVTIADHAMTAAALVQDTLFVDRVAAARSGGHALVTASVSVGRNAWLGLSCLVLDGATVGNDSVVAAGACLRQVEVPAYHLASGSPAARPLPIDRLLGLRAPA